MAKEEYIIKIINNEFEKIFKSFDSISKADNDGLSKNKIFFMKLYKNIEITKSNILLNIKKYFAINKFTNIKSNQIFQLTKILNSKKRNKSQNKLKFQTNINMNNNKTFFHSIIDSSSTDLKKNNSFLSPSSNNKKIKIKPLIIDAKNGRNSINFNSNNATYYNNLNNINTNNSNIINNPFNINNLISDEEGEQEKKIIFSKKSSLIKKHFNYLLNKSHSELKLGLKDKKNSFSSNKVYHQKKKISLVNDLLNNMTIFNKAKNKKNLKLFINSINLEGKPDKIITFPVNQNKNEMQTLCKNKKKITMNKINIPKLHFNTKTEVINKKKKMINISSNKYVKKNKNIITKIVNNNFKRNDNKLNRIYSHSVNVNNICNNINNSLSYNIIDNDDSINDKNIDLAKEIIYFLDNFKNLQNSIIKKDVDTKKLKLNFEMQKVSLYNKAKKILNNSQNNNSNNNNNNNFNETKSNISNNSKGLNSTTVKSDSISYIKNYFGNNKNNQSGLVVKNINNNDSNTKDLNLSIINLKKTIEDMKLNDEITSEQYKNEIKDLNNKIKEKEKIIKDLNSENFEKIIRIYKTLLNYSNNKDNLICNVPSDKRFGWYIHQINEMIETAGKEWKKLNDNSENIKNNNINNNEIKEQLFKATIDIINWLQPYMQLKNDDVKTYISQLEEDFKNYGIKQALNSLKSKIKELIYLLEVKNGPNNSNINNIIEKEKFLKFNSILLNIENNLKEKIEKKNNEIHSMQNDLKNSLTLNNKILNKLTNYFPQQTRIVQEKYDYILSLYNAEQNKVNLLQNEFLNMIEGLIDYIENGNKIYIELCKMWNITPKKETNFEFIEPDSSDMGYLSESDLLSNGSKKLKEANLDLEKYKKEIEEYKITFKYLENKINKYENLLKNIVDVLTKIIKNMKMNQKQKELFFTLFRMLNIKDEKIISFINSEN